MAGIFLGYATLESISHVGENLLSLLRDGVGTVDAEIATALLSMTDAVRAILVEIEQTGSEGDKDGPEKLKNSASSGRDVVGDGGFIHLRKRERDKVQQDAAAQFPAEFRELIKQYNINIKNNRPGMPQR